MIVVLLSLAVALTLLEPLSFVPTLSAAWAGPAIAAYLVVAAVIAAANTTWSLREAVRGSFLSPRALRRHRLGGVLGQVYLVGGLAGVLLAGYRTAIVGTPTLMGVPLVGTLLAWAPFAAALLMTWVLEYPFYQTVRVQMAAVSPAGAAAVRVWTLEEYVLYNVRHHLLFVAVPVSLMVLVGDVLRLWVCPLLPAAAADIVLPAGSLAGAGAVFVVSPAILVRIWRTSPLPSGRLRDDLAALCRRMRLGYRDILIWHSGGAIANAAMMGLIGPIRYVLLSDALLANLDERSIRAIFAHEAGHIRHHHIFYSVLFALAATGLCAAVAQQAAAWMNWGDDAALAIMLPLLAAAWVFGFGWISRRFERQSDVTGVRFAGQDPADDPSPPSAPPPADLPITPVGVAVFCHALHRVALLGSIPMAQRNWRHGSVASRIAYLMFPRAGGSAHPVDRQVRLVKVALWVALAAAVAANAFQFFYLPAPPGPS